MNSSVYSEEIPRKPKFWIFSDFPRKFVGIFWGSHFPSELRCFLVVLFFISLAILTRLYWLVSIWNSKALVSTLWCCFWFDFLHYWYFRIELVFHLILASFVRLELLIPGQWSLIVLTYSLIHIITHLLDSLVPLSRYIHTVLSNGENLIRRVSFIYTDWCI